MVNGAAKVSVVTYTVLRIKPMFCHHYLPIRIAATLLSLAYSPEVVAVHMWVLYTM